MNAKHLTDTESGIKLESKSNFNEVGVLVNLEDEISPLSPEAVQRFETVAAQHQGFFVEAIDSERLLGG